MASQPEVTVIIPNYNGKKLLENCIQTLEKQTCTDFKLLVVDNGSDDGSTEVTSSLDLTMLALKENTGFCGGHTACRHAVCHPAQQRHGGSAGIRGGAACGDQKVGPHLFRGSNDDRLS